MVLWTHKFCHIFVLLYPNIYTYLIEVFIADVAMSIITGYVTHLTNIVAIASLCRKRD